MKGTELKAWIKDHKLSQEAVAKILGVSQKTVSNMQKRLVVPAEVVEQLDRHGIVGGIVSDSQTWPVPIFEALRSSAPKRAKRVDVRAVIQPAKSGKGAGDMADYAAEMVFTELTLNGQRLYIDHIRSVGLSTAESEDEPIDAPALLLGGSPLMPSSMVSVKGPNKSQPKEIAIKQGSGLLYVKQRVSDRGPIFDLGEMGVVRARLEEDRGVRTPQYLAYELFNADPDAPVSIFLHSERGYQLDNMDAIGYAYYTEADFLVEEITLQVEFRGGLIPDPDPPNPRAQLIRRTSLRPNSLARNFPKPTRVEKGDTITYTFGPLLRPKGGFLYSLVWGKLIRSGKRPAA